MAQSSKYSLRDLKRDYSTNEACLEVMFEALHTRECSCGAKYKRLEKRLQFQCSKCRFQIAPMVGTIFEKSTTPLTLWFHALFIFSNAKSGISAKEMERQLGVTYKTAWRILMLIRTSLRQGRKKLKGDVEMDEMYFGGRYRAGKDNKHISEAMLAKSIVTGAVERKGRIKAEVAQTGGAYALGQFLDKNVDPSGTRLLTDASNRYEKVAVGYKRAMVNHKNREFVRGDVHVNTIESFWSHVKRSVTGTHKVISKKYLQSYLDGFVWHRNNRYSDSARFYALLGALLCA